jgi:magnesium transporter
MLARAPSAREQVLGVEMPFPANQFVITDVLQAFTGAQPETLTTWLKEVQHPVDRERQIAKLSNRELHRIGEAAATEDVVNLLESIDEGLAARVLTAMAPADAARIADALDIDDAAEILRKTKDSVREAVLAALPTDRSTLFRELLSWPEDSVAAHMVPEALTVRPEMTVADVIEAVRVDAFALRMNSRTGAYVYVVGGDGELLGVVAFRDLVLSDPTHTVAELMVGDVRTVSPLTSAERAAQMLASYDLVALPVVDQETHLLGLLTEDAAADIAEDEATEDAERQGGSAPLDVPYLRASPITLWRKRVVWLLLLFIAEAYTGTVLRAFEDELEAVVALAFFIPLLIGTGGNTGTQITTTLIRALATGQVRLRDLPAVLVKEISTAVLVAATMGLAAVIRAWTLGVGSEVTVTVALSVVAIVLWSAFVATVLPPLLKKIRVDPAIVSAPAIATIVDGTGLMIYFSIAHLTLSQLHGG